MFNVAGPHHVIELVCAIYCFVSFHEVKYKRKNIFQIKMIFWIYDSYIEKTGMNKLVAELESETSLMLCGIASVNAVDTDHPSLKHVSGNEIKKIWLQLPVSLTEEIDLKLWSIEEDGTAQTCSVLLVVATCDFCFNFTGLSRVCAMKKSTQIFTVHAICVLLICCLCHL